MADEDKLRDQDDEDVSTMLLPQPAGIPLPRPSAVSQPFWAGCARGQLNFQRCRTCGSAVFNPAALCPYCASIDLMWEISSGFGVIYSWTIVWRPPRPAFHTPYAPAIIELDEGFRMISNVVGIETSKLRTGVPVQAEFHGHGAITLPYFTPTDGSTRS